MGINSLVAIVALALGAVLGALIAQLRLRGRLGAVAEERTRLEATLAGERQAAADREALLRQSGTELRDAFKALSADALQSSNERFLELARATFAKEQAEAAGALAKREEAVKGLVDPIAKSLEAMARQIQEVEKERKESEGGLTESLRAFGEDQRKLRHETRQLVSALRKPQGRGQWGEMQLKRVVEMAGMLDHCDFHEQVATDSGDGQLRPDLVVHLPGGTQVVVDAKTPLEAWLDALEAEDDETRKQQLVRHARHVKDHVVKLSRKGYAEQFDETPEFVVMFLPSEAVFYAALEVNPGLIEEGVDHRVLLATPTTLIALLRAVAFGWQQEAMTKNAREIKRLGIELYDRTRTLAAHFVALGKSLDKTVENYNRSVASLERQFLPAARRFSELGIPAKKEVPQLDSLEKSSRQLQAPELQSDVPAEESDAEASPEDGAQSADASSGG